MQAHGACYFRLEVAAANGGPKPYGFDTWAELWAKYTVIAVSCPDVDRLELTVCTQLQQQLLQSSAASVALVLLF